MNPFLGLIYCFSTTLNYFLVLPCPRDIGLFDAVVLVVGFISNIILKKSLVIISISNQNHFNLMLFDLFKVLRSFLIICHFSIIEDFCLYFFCQRRII